MCGVCKKGFVQTYKNKYCSEVCRKININSRITDHYNLSPGTIGALNELKVCADLMIKGYNVFRCVSPNSPHDLIISNDERILRVEVTTGTKHVSGNISHAGKTDRDFDILAIVVFSGEIIYKPDIFSECPQNHLIPFLGHDNGSTHEKIAIT